MNKTLALSALLSTPALAATTATDISPWPTRRIPYNIEEVIPAKTQTIIRAAIQRVNALGIVNFTEIAGDNFNEAMMVFTYKKNQCSSTYGGGDGSSTLVKVSERCEFGNTVHEILHGLGLVHEEVNPEMVAKVNLDRVVESAEDQHAMATAVALTPHDPASIMHYHSFDDSICDHPTSGKWTTLPKDRLPPRSCLKKNWRELDAAHNGGVDCPTACSIFLSVDGKPYGRQRQDLSPLDIEGLRLLYRNAQ